MWVDIFLKEWKLIGESVPILLICGIDSIEARWKPFIQDNELLSVKMIGFVSINDIKKLIANSKALILSIQ